MSIKLNKETRALIINLFAAEETFAKTGENHRKLLRAFLTANVTKDNYLEAFKSVIDKQTFGVWPVKESKAGEVSDVGYQAAMKAGYVPAIAYNRFQAVAGKLEYKDGYPIVEGDGFKKLTRTPKTSKASAKGKGSLVETKEQPATPPVHKEPEASPPVKVTADTVRIVLELLGAKYASDPDATAMINGLAEKEGFKLNIPVPPPITKSKPAEVSASAAH